MAIGAGGIDGVDAVDPAVEHRGALEDVLRVGAVRWVEFGGDGEFAAPEHPFQPAARGMAGQGIERRAGILRVDVRAHGFCSDGEVSRMAAACAVTRSQEEVSRND